MVAADDRKELVERKGCAMIFRLILMLFVLAVCTGVCLIVGYIYYTESYFNHENSYTWVVVFFASQVIGFFVYDLIIISMISCCVSKCCRKNKVCLTRVCKESLYVYEDLSFVSQFSKSTE